MSPLSRALRGTLDAILGGLLIPSAALALHGPGVQGPLGQWPDFQPIGYITAPHPNNPSIPTHLYGDWGAIVGEETLLLDGDELKLLYHSWHETYLTKRTHGAVRACAPPCSRLQLSRGGYTIQV